MVSLQVHHVCGRRRWQILFLFLNLCKYFPYYQDINCFVSAFAPPPRSLHDTTSLLLTRRRRQQQRSSPHQTLWPQLFATPPLQPLSTTIAAGALLNGATSPKNNNNNNEPTVVVAVEHHSEMETSTALSSSLSSSSSAAPETASENVAVNDHVTTISSTPQPSSPQSNSSASQEHLYSLAVSSLIGILTGLNIVVFKRSIEYVREFCYGDSYISSHFPLFIIPLVGGIAVGALIFLGGDFAPGLRGTITESDRDARDSIERNKIEGSNEFSMLSDLVTIQQQALQSFRKALAAVATLGSGNSLGPEGPSTEAGLAVGRLCSSVPLPMSLFGHKEFDAEAAVARRRLLLSCGAAAGVSAGFNAPVAGVFFALEIVQRALNSADQEAQDKTPPAEQLTAAPRKIQDSLTMESINISAILLSSVISALVTKLFLGNEEALRVQAFSLLNPLVELPLYLLLGACAGVVAALFSSFAKVAKSFFNGDIGPASVRDTFKHMPKWSKPTLGALFCGAVGSVYPQTLFFGYETLNGLLAVKSFSSTDAMILLGAKFSTTAVAAASGLVGGTFAPSLFLGGMLGAAFHNSAQQVGTALTLYFPQIEHIYFDVSDLPAYAMVGGSSVLAALFRAPLTASLLMFECTKNYDVILPLMASAGIGSLVGDIVEQALEEQRRDLDSVSWGDLAMTKDNSEEEENKP